MQRKQMARSVAVALGTGLLLATGPLPPAAAAGGPNLAGGRAASASSSNGQFTAANVNDRATWSPSTSASPVRGTCG